MLLKSSFHIICCSNLRVPVPIRQTSILDALDKIMARTKRARHGTATPSDDAEETARPVKRAKTDDHMEKTKGMFCVKI